jgi:hypothetical protein
MSLQNSTTGVCHALLRFPAHSDLACSAEVSRTQWPLLHLVVVTPGFKAKPNAHSMCAQESSFHTYHIENGYRITNVSI